MSEPSSPRVLNYDSQLFGFPVARIDQLPCDELSIKAMLTELRRQGVGLVYAYTAGGELVEAAAARAGGTLVDRRITYVADLTTSGSLQPLAAVEIVPFTGEPTPALKSLALASGIHSRFRIDPRVPQGIYEELYLTWLAKSVSGELAERVFVTRAAGVECGFVTTSSAGENGANGLTAVEERMRGQGIGRELYRAGLRYHFSMGRRFVKLPTQQHNPICNLYAGSGCSVEQIQLVYHFWLR